MLLDAKAQPDLRAGLAGTLRQSQARHVFCQHDEYVMGSIVSGFPFLLPLGVNPSLGPD